MSAGRQGNEAGAGKSPWPAIDYRLTRWKVVSIAAATLLVVSGLGIRLLAGPAANDRGSISRAEGSPGTSPGGVGGTSLVEGAGDPFPLPPAGPGQESVEGQDSLAEWSPALLKGGFGFFVGFCVGFAVRQFLRLAAVLVGLNLIVLTLLGTQGWVDVRWDVMAEQFDRFLDHLAPQIDSFKSFLTGSLPSAGLATLGLVAGLKKR